jgi:DNA-binding XRE family transcriptional regulator
MNDDMKVNRSLILSLRKQRSWSQDELAVAAGLNLRTVQRIECSGSASLQSKKSLAAAFGIEVSDLESPEESMTSKYEYRVVRFDMKWSGRGRLETDVATIEKEMSALGAEGWELVKTSEIQGAGFYTIALIATFKRGVQ